MHIEFLVEEESAAEALKHLLPNLGVSGDNSFHCHVFQGKQDLMNHLPDRLRGYASWLPCDWRIVVLVDRDNEDCHVLKKQLDTAATSARLVTRGRAGQKLHVQLINRIAIEELEAWFFGDIAALCKAYPGVPKTLAQKQGFRNPDQIAGGTWEQLERQLKRAGYYPTGMPKIEVARNISRHMDPSCNQSKSFCAFREAVGQLIPKG